MSGPRTRSVRRSPLVAATRASTVPSPPSAIGTSTRSASAAAARTPSRIASAAWSADSEPLNALGAITMRISASRLVNRRQPVTVLAVASADDVEVELLQPGHHWADLAVADRTAIDIDHRRDLRPCAAEKDFVSDVELRAIDRSLNDF